MRGPERTDDGEVLEIRRPTHDVVLHVDRYVEGRAMGGCRVLRPAEAEAYDVRALAADLARTMTEKARAARVPVGGSKFVVALRSDHPDVRRAALADVAELLHVRRGRVFTGQDYGLGEADVEVLYEMAPFGVVGVPGRGLDPAVWTARGVLAALRAVRVSLPLGAGVPRAHVQGVGKVGARVVEGLVRDGWRVGFSETDPRRAREVAEATGARPEPFGAPCDVLVPCAGSRVLDPEPVLGSGARAVCGSANLPWRHGRDAEHTIMAGVFVAPDHVVNAGGLIAVAAEVVGYGEDGAAARVATIADAVCALIRRFANGVAPSAILHPDPDELWAETVTRLPDRIPAA